MLATIPAARLHAIGMCLNAVGSAFLAAAERSADMHPLWFHLELLLAV